MSAFSISICRMLAFRRAAKRISACTAFNNQHFRFRTHVIPHPYIASRHPGRWIRNHFVNLGSAALQLVGIRTSGVQLVGIQTSAVQLVVIQISAVQLASIQLSGLQLTVLRILTSCMAPSRQPLRSEQGFCRKIWEGSLDFGRILNVIWAPESVKSTSNPRIQNHQYSRGKGSVGGCRRVSEGGVAKWLLQQWGLIHITCRAPFIS